jgi:NADPH:quinone reductase-like Zn-dependent oxidoreductase
LVAHEKMHERNYMKAVVVENYDSIDGISIKEMDLPAVSKGEVRVRIGAAAVGFVDGLKVQGLYQTKDPLPFVPGTEFAGVVDAVASDVTAFKPGAPVIGMTRSGALAEYISVPSAAIKNLPAQVPFEAGASFQANYLTGLYALDARASLQAGEILLVLGAAGGVGIAAVQIGKLMGARVIAAASTQEKRDFAIQFGADETIDYTQANWRDALKAMTGGHGPDVILDPVGGEVALQALSFDRLARPPSRGRIRLWHHSGAGVQPAPAQGRRAAWRRPRPDPEARAGNPRPPDRATVRLACLRQAEAGRRQGGAVREFPRGVQDHAVAVGTWEDDRQIRLKRPPCPPAALQQDRTDASGRLCWDARPPPHAYAFGRMHRLSAR